MNPLLTEDQRSPEPWASLAENLSESEPLMSEDFESQAMRELEEVPAVEVITATAVHLMSAAAVQVGLAESGYKGDLDEARKLITALAGLLSATSPDLGDHHARPLRDGLRSLQLAFREASVIKDEPGQGPGEKFTGPVN